MNAALPEMRRAAAVDDVRPAVKRGELFFWTALVLIANALAGPAIADIAMQGFASSALNLFGISAMIFAAGAAALALLHADESAPGRADFAVVAACILIALLPNYTSARLMVSVLGIYLLFASTPGSTTRRGAIVIVALGGALFWGLVMLASLGHPVLELDAMLTSWLYGFERVGNTIAFADGTAGGVIIAAGCSSWHGLSIALLFWIMIYQWFGIPIRARSFLWLALALLATIVVNSLRIAALVSYPAHFDELHHGLGATAASWATMLLVVAVCLFGERREIFTR